MIFQTKKTAECQTEQENTIVAQKKDEDRFCFEIHVQKNTNKVCVKLTQYLWFA